MPAAALLPAAASAVRARDLNRTHSMAAMRARAGRVVRGIEERRRRGVAERVRRLAPRVVVDVGCEDGWIAEAYAEGVERLLLVDADPDVLARAPLASRPGVETVVADALAPAPVTERLAGRAADVVVLSAILEHVEDPARCVAGWIPLVRPGGHLVAYVPADGPILLAKRALRLLRAGAWLPGLSLEPAPGHVRTFSRASLVRCLAPFGRVEEVAFDPACLGWHAVLRRS